MQAGVGKDCGLTLFGSVHVDLDMYTTLQPPRYPASISNLKCHIDHRSQNVFIMSLKFLSDIFLDSQSAKLLLNPSQCIVNLLSTLGRTKTNTIHIALLLVPQESHAHFAPTRAGGCFILFSPEQVEFFCIPTGFRVHNFERHELHFGRTGRQSNRRGLHSIIPLSFCTLVCAGTSFFCG